MFLLVFFFFISFIVGILYVVVKINCSLVVKMCFGNILNKCFECYDKIYVDLVREGEMKCST